MTPEDDTPAQRRDNGLRADRFIALADVDPRLGEHLLDLLRLADIAAYLEPPADPRTSTRYQIDGPIERLYVHATQREAAHQVVLAAAAEAGEHRPQAAPSTRSAAADLLAGIDTDAEFARIMARFDAAAAPDRIISPDAATRPDVVTSPDVVISPDVLDAAAKQSALAAREQQRAQDAAEDESYEEHFEPPPPPAFVMPSAAAILGGVLVAVGLFLIVYGSLVGFGDGFGLPAGVMSVLAGAAILISRMRTHPRDDDEDGAVL